MKQSNRPLGLILAGGLSKRLFPVQTPKPLLKVAGKFLLQEALERLEGFDVFVVTNQKIANEIKKSFETEGLKVPSFIIEAEPRDTAAAVGFALSQVQLKPSWVAVLSADQWMPEGKASFQSFLKDVDYEIAEHPDSLFVAGSPSDSKAPHSHSQFGWMIPETEEGAKSFKVKQFIEKPNGEKLEEILKASGLINAGMFFGRWEVFMEAYKNFYPEVLDKDLKYSELKKLPIDKAIFENYEKVRALKLPVKWEDLGTWEDWFKFVGSQKFFKAKSENCSAFTDSDFEVYTFGVSDLYIIQSGNKLLVLPESKSREMKDFLSLIQTHPQ